MLRYLMLIAGIVLLLLLQFVTSISAETQLFIFLAGIVVLGIPHGAADMLVANQTASIKKIGFSKIFFLVKYLFRLGLFAAMFWFFPVIANFLFILFAAYHFGETDLNIFKTESFAGKLFVVSYGMMILGVILLAHFNDIIPMFYLFESGRANETLINIISEHRYNILTALTVFFFASTFLYFASTEKTSFHNGQFLLQLAVLLFILFYLPMVIGFTFYFIMWHSMLSLKNIIHYLNINTKLSNTIIIKQLLLYSGLAMVGILIFGWSGMMFVSGDAVMVYVFIGLAVLTAPHMQIMYDMYNSIRSQKNADLQ
ncbi:MAG: Brp/Blh family beta-carotene 15,15'-dioxygenase [Ferruginibacter sp.]